MPHLAQKPCVTSKIELETVTNWRLIITALVAQILFVSALAGFSYLLPRKDPRLLFHAAPPQVKAPFAIQRNRPSSVQPHTSPTRAEVNAATNVEVAKPVPVKKEAALQAVKLTKPRPQPSPPKTVTATKPAALVISPQLKKHEEPVPSRVRNYLSEELLSLELRSLSRDIKIDTVNGTSANLLAQDGSSKLRTVLDLLPQRPDLTGLPIRTAADCQLERAAARNFEAFSQMLRMALSTLHEESSSPLRHDDVMHMEHQRLTQSIWRDRQAVGPLVQVLQGEDTPLRLMLVRMLSRIADPAASVALARCAIFDLCGEVRDDALRALLDRRREEYRKVFLDGLRYPWPPVADHAAEALVALRDHAAIPDLSSLLGKPDPAAPVSGPDHKVQVAELVCVNHLQNCLLCHAPSVHGSGLVRAPIPSTDQPLSEQFLYYRSFQGPAVRADTTYLKQDFAALQPVADHGVWPEVQRYDYMIRMRELTASELKLLEQKRASHQTDQAATYPQREAVLFALKGLKESSIAAFFRVVGMAH